MNTSRIGVAALIALTACTVGGRSTVPASTTAATPRFAGTFAGDLGVEGYRNPMLVTVHDDGTLTSSDGNDFAGAEHGQFNSPGYGAWQATGERTTQFTVREFEYDSAGHYLGTSTIQGTGTYSADWSEVTGTMAITTWRGKPGPSGLTYRVRRTTAGAP